MENDNGIVELGSASIATKGPGGEGTDVAIGRQLGGLSDD
jgi:hypothetical protein